MIAKRWFVAGMLAVLVLFLIGSVPVSASTISMWNSGAGNWDWSRSKLTANYFNGDANGDVAILYNYGGDSTALWLFTSAGTTFNPTTTAKWNSGSGNWDWNRSKMVSGNFVGSDVYRDIAILYDYGNSATGLWVFKGTATGFDPPSAKWNSGAGNWDWNRSKIVAGIFNLSDSYTDIAVLYDYGNSTTGLWIFPGTATGAFGAPTQVWNSGPGNWDWNRSQLTAQDINNDGISELAILYDYGNAATGIWTIYSAAVPVVVYNNWSSGAGNWDWNRSKLAGLLWALPLGDMAILYDYGNSNTALWIFPGVGLNSPSQYWSSGIGNWDWNRSMLTATDANGSGLDDAIIFYDYGGSTSGLWGIF